jgi:surface-anchored protein
MRSGTSIFLAILSSAFACSGAAGANVYHLAEGHADLSILHHQENSTNRLTLAVHQDGPGRTFANDAVVLVAGDGARFELPPGTPFGEAGDPLWILPQSAYPGVLYLGLSTEQVTQGAFQGSLRLSLAELDMPGRIQPDPDAAFYVWQAGQLGGLEVFMNSADEITAADTISIPAGAHAHYNWGFNMPGLWHVTFQASGRLTGQSTNITSPPLTFAFHVLPLSPFEQWQATNWPPGTARGIIGPESDPDEDGVINLLEYAFGLDPADPGRDGLPTSAIVVIEGERYGALTYQRNKAAMDLTFEVVAANSLNASEWQVLSGVHMVIDNGDSEQVTVRDALPVSHWQQRFYRLNVHYSK